MQGIRNQTNSLVSASDGNISNHQSTSKKYNSIIFRIYARPVTVLGIFLLSFPSPIGCIECSNSGEHLQQWSIDDTQAWFYTRSIGKESHSSASSGADCPYPPLSLPSTRRRPVLKRNISMSSTFQIAKESNDRDLVLAIQPFTKFQPPIGIQKLVSDPSNADRRRKYFQNKVSFTPISCYE